MSLFSKSLFIWSADTLMLLATEKIDVSLANNFAVDKIQCH